MKSASATEGLLYKNTGKGFVISLLWFAFFVLSPFYFFPSGMPQPADYLIPLIFVIILLGGKLGIYQGLGPILKATTRFFAVLLAVALCWTLLELARKDLGFEKAFTAYMKPVLFYTFNAIAVFCFCRLISINPKYAVVSTMCGSLMTLIIQFGLIVVEFGFRKIPVRVVGNFNNPNQMCYFAILNGVIAIAICGYFLNKGARRRTNPSGFLTSIAAIAPFIVIPIVLYLSYASGSRSGLVAAILMAGLAFLKSARSLIFLVIASLLIGVLFADQTGDLVQQRMGRRKDQSLSLNALGRYHRIFENPEYCVFGAAEGNKARFNRKGGHEVHSTVGTILFSYGIPALVLYCLIYFELYREGGWWFLMMATPPLVYGLSHNGLRQTELWLVPVVFYFIAISAKTQPEYRLSPYATREAK